MMTGLSLQKRGANMGGNNYRPLPRIILATALAIGFGILVWRNRPSIPLMQNVPVERAETDWPVRLERVAADPADTWAGNVIVYSDTVTNSEPVIDHDHFPFTLLDDPWKDMDPGEISQEEHERWLNEKRAFIVQEAKAGFEARQALWEQLVELENRKMEAMPTGVTWTNITWLGTNWPFLEERGR